MSLLDKLKNLLPKSKAQKLVEEQGDMTDTFMKNTESFALPELDAILNKSLVAIRELENRTPDDDAAENRRRFWEVISWWVSAKIHFLTGNYGKGYLMAEKALEKSYEIRKSKPEMFEIPLYALMGASLMMSHWSSAGSQSFSKDDPRLAEFYITRAFDSASIFDTVFWREKAIAGRVLTDFYRLVLNDEQKASEWDQKRMAQEKIGGILSAI